MKGLPPGSQGLPSDGTYGSTPAELADALRRQLRAQMNVPSYFLPAAPAYGWAGLTFEEAREWLLREIGLA